MRIYRCGEPLSHLNNPCPVINDLKQYKILFEKNTLKTAKCWFWQGAKTRERDGREKPVIKIGKKSRAATKVSWELYRGEIPEQMQIRQSCKNDLCVNPHHLELIRQSYGRI